MVSEMRRKELVPLEAPPRLVKRDFPGSVERTVVEGGEMEEALMPGFLAWGGRGFAMV
jgi:hypothetical protein